MTVQMQTTTKGAPAQMLDGGALEGYASTYGNVDRVGDRVMPGAFGTTPFKMPLFYNHDEPIGGAVCTPDQIGLHVQATLANTPKAQEVRELMRVGAVPFMSFMYGIQKSEPNNSGGLDLYGLDTMEVSAVPIPANPQAAVMAMKRLGAVPSVDCKVGRRNAEKDQASIQAAHDALVAAGANCGKAPAQAEDDGKALGKMPMGPAPAQMEPPASGSASDATVSNPVDLAQACDELVDQAIAHLDAGELDELDATLSAAAVVADQMLALFGASDPDA